MAKMLIYYYALYVYIDSHKVVSWWTQQALKNIVEELLWEKMAKNQKPVFAQKCFVVIIYTNWLPWRIFIDFYYLFHLF